MTKQEYALELAIQTSPHDWAEKLQSYGLGQEDLQLIAREADNVAVALAELSRYLEYSAHNQDSHDRALKLARHRGQAVRKAMGYTYP